jgi:hypothetical protein
MFVSIFEATGLAGLPALPGNTNGLRLRVSLVRRQKAWIPVMREATIGGRKWKRK